MQSIATLSLRFVLGTYNQSRNDTRELLDGTEVKCVCVNACVCERERAKERECIHEYYLAPGLSILFKKHMQGTSCFSACRQTVMVWALRTKTHTHTHTPMIETRFPGPLKCGWTLDMSSLVLGAAARSPHLHSCWNIKHGHSPIQHPQRSLHLQSEVNVPYNNNMPHWMITLVMTNTKHFQ